MLFESPDSERYIIYIHIFLQDVQEFANLKEKPIPYETDTQATITIVMVF